MPDVTNEIIKESAESAVAAEGAAQEAMQNAGSEAGAPDVTRTAASAMEEFTRFKQAEMNLKEVMLQEERARGGGMGEGLGKALAEGLKMVGSDPEMREALKAYLWGPEIAQDVYDPSEIKQMRQQQQLQPVETMDASDPAKEVAGTIEGIAQEISEEHEEVTTDQVIQLLQNNLEQYGPMLKQRISQELEEQLNES